MRCEKNGMDHAYCVYFYSLYDEKLTHLQVSLTGGSKFEVFLVLYRQYEKSIFISLAEYGIPGRIFI